MFLVRGNLEERGGTRLEEQIVDDAFIRQGQPRELMREREDDVVEPTGRSSACRAASHRLRACVRHLGSAGCDTS